MKQYLLILCTFLTVLGCKSQSCHDLPTHFDSYSSAINTIRNADFELTDNIPSGSSSWIMSANYYSCDKRTGYMIYTTIKGGKYIHLNVPVEIWNNFKNAPSKGSYYDRNIKGRYRLIVG